MALASATATDEVVLLGVGEPFAYDAGSVDGRTYPAGVSQRVCVGSLDGRDFYVMKLRTDAVQRLRDVLSGVPRGARVKVEYQQYRGQYQLTDLVVL